MALGGRCLYHENSCGGQTRPFGPAPARLRWERTWLKLGGRPRRLGTPCVRPVASPGRCDPDGVGPASVARKRPAEAGARPVLAQEPFVAAACRGGRVERPAHCLALPLVVAAPSVGRAPTMLYGCAAALIAAGRARHRPPSSAGRSAPPGPWLTGRRSHGQYDGVCTYHRADGSRARHVYRVGKDRGGCGRLRGAPGRGASCARMWPPSWSRRVRYVPV